MKFLSVILAFLILSLSLRKCYEFHISPSPYSIEIEINKNHNKKSHDECSFNCICYCCGNIISFQEIVKFNVTIVPEIPTPLVALYQSTYKFDSLFSIWQPPKNNS